jgi:hypothetical protein
MDASLRPHRGGTVLALGIVGLLSPLILVPLGVAAWVLGSKELRGMNEGRIDPAGRTPTQVGRVFGIVGTGLWVLIAGLTLLMVFATWSMRISSSTIGDGPTRTRETYFSQGWFDSGPTRVELEYTETVRPDGEWVKNGHFTHWSRDGKILEQGDYKDGKRTGLWTFLHEDGSADRERTGIYENDVKTPD